MRTSIRCFALSLSFLLLLVMAAPARAQSEAECPAVTVDPDPRNRWSPGAAISVYLDPNLSESAQLAFIDSLHTWANQPMNQSRVTFSFVENNPGPGVPNTLRIMEEIPRTFRHAETAFNPQVENSALIRYDPANDNPYAWPHLQLAMHEIGHTFGLQDCGSCPQLTTPMRPFDDPNEDHLTGVTDCDAWRVPPAPYAEYSQEEAVGGDGPDQSQDNYSVCTHWYLVRYRCYVGGPCVEVSRTYLYSDCY